MNNILPSLGANAPITRTIEPPPGSSIVPAEQPQPGRVLQGGGAFIQEDENLLVTVFNLASGVTIHIGVRMRNERGDYVPTVRSITPNSAGTAHLTLINVGPGHLQGVFMYVTAGSPGATDCYVEVGIQQGSIAARSNQVQIVATGYITANASLSYPAQTTNSLLIGQGVLFADNSSGSIAGGGISVDHSTGYRYKFKGAHITITTSATAGNRFLRLFTSNTGGAIAQEVLCPIAQAASLTYDYLIGDYQESAAIIAGTRNYIKMKVAELFMYGSSVRFNIAMDNVQTGDAVVSPGAIVQWEQWREPA